MEHQKEVTRLLQRAEAGDTGFYAELLPVVYAELRQLAHAQMRAERKDHTLQTTALVHEAFIRLTGATSASKAGAQARTGSWFGAEPGNRYFFAAAGEAMRRILVEHARARSRLKRGGDGRRAAAHAPLSATNVASDQMDDRDMLRLDMALSRLEQEDADAAQVVRLRFFAGLTRDQAADALGVSARTVDRDWAFARARLFQLMWEDTP